MLKTNPAVLTGTGIPLDSHIFVNQSLRRCYKYLWFKFKKLWLGKYLTGEILFNYDVEISQNSNVALFLLEKYQIGNYQHHAPFYC